MSFARQCTSPEGITTLAAQQGWLQVDALAKSNDIDTGDIRTKAVFSTMLFDFVQVADFGHFSKAHASHFVYI
jgi:hypothetical protein